MVTATFKPSQVVPFFPNSAFMKGERETMAAWILSFLREEKSDEWVEFTYVELIQYMRKHLKTFNDAMDRTETCTVPGMNGLYLQMSTGPFARNLFNEFAHMVREGFFILREEGTNQHLTVADKMMEFYSCYVSTQQA
jgi:hypothetical protein